MNNTDERVWAYLLKNRQATVEEVMLNCDVSGSYAEKIMSRISSPNWREEVTEGQKFDSNKLRYELLPPELLEEVARVLTFGAHKYSARNWELGMAWSRPFGALMRHMWAWWRGEEKDPETGYSHLAHAACCIAFLVAYEARNTGTDDRPKG
jgi:hypothetical protein